MRAINWLVSTHFPFQSALNKIFVRLYGIDLKEHRPVEAYSTLQEIFTRKLLAKRKIGKGIISPVDGIITQQSIVKDGTVLQIKGKPYKVKELIKQDKNIENWVYINFYLSPKDYHRYHAPCDIKVHRLMHIPGKLLPVNNFFLNRKKNLFVENERTVLECTAGKKRLFLVFVGAFNVGSINFNFEPDSRRTVSYKKPISTRKGEELGFFSLGSTVVALFESIDTKIKTGPIRFGESIGV